MDVIYPHCSRCGTCCLHVDRVAVFSDMALPDGKCRYLSDENLCKIYQNRPNLCRAEYVYRIHYNHLSIEEYFKMMNSLCKQLQKENSK